MLPLTCEECGREEADDERGWRSYLTTDEEEPAEAVIYCRECAEREFGAGEARLKADSRSAELRFGECGSPGFSWSPLA